MIVLYYGEGDVVATWKEEIEKLEKCPQRQDSVKNQVKDLILVANKLGFYDAADYLRTAFRILK